MKTQRIILLKEGIAMKFTKMHGLGNDFLLFEDDGSGRDWNAIAKVLCRRRLSVGADGILVMLPSDVADLKMRIINADGSEAEMCGNGIRCFAKYAYDEGIVSKTNLTVETLAGIMHPRLYVENGTVTGVRVDMGKPSFDRRDIPMKGEGTSQDIDIEAAGMKMKISSVLMGVPHTIVIEDDIASFDIKIMGPAIERLDLFPKKTNVNFIKIIDRENISIRTWERGAEETMACGTGACASVVVLSAKNLIEKKAYVHLEAGELLVEYLEDGRVMMTGPAASVYKAEIDL
jgi:diaminopimelate epimerase